MSGKTTVLLLFLLGLLMLFIKTAGAGELLPNQNSPQKGPGEGKRWGLVLTHKLPEIPKVPTFPRFSILLPLWGLPLSSKVPNRMLSDYQCYFENNILGLTIGQDIGHLTSVWEVVFPAREWLINTIGTGHWHKESWYSLYLATRNSWEIWGCCRRPTNCELICQVYRPNPKECKC